MRADGWVYRVVLALSGITLVLVVVYLVMTQQNRAVQAEVNQRQQFISQGIELERLNNALVQAIARNAASDKDDKLRNLLTQNGVGINPVTGAPFEKTSAPVAAAPAQLGK